MDMAQGFLRLGGWVLALGLAGCTVTSGSVAGEPSGGAGGVPPGTGGSLPSGGAGGQGSTECLAPDQNLAVAYTAELPGCACGDVGAACVDGVALVCVDNAWQAVEDGPCTPMDLACDGRLASVNDCVTLFEVCVEMDNGLFCGMTPKTPLCANGELVEGPGDCLVDDAYCLELENGLWCTGTGAPSCPAGYDPVTDGSCTTDTYSCFRYSESLACRIPTLDADACELAGGVVHSDPGDGSLMAAGCPAPARAIAFISGFIEGGLCCQIPPD